MEIKKLEELEKNIGYKFKNIKLLQNALTHTSYAYENGVPSNEKLEFLGDSILEFVSSEYMYNKYQNLKEGQLTKVRATVVCGKSLYNVAKKHNFGDFMYLGKSELKTNESKRTAILADSVEAVIAAIFIDGGLEPAKTFIIDNLKDAIDIATKHVGEKDYKTVLQEELQKNGEVKIEYTIIGESGPDHDKTFEAEVSLNGKVLANGMGKSKKEAEMQAARKALEYEHKKGEVYE